MTGPEANSTMSNSGQPFGRDMGHSGGPRAVAIWRFMTRTGLVVIAEIIVRSCPAQCDNSAKKMQTCSADVG
jgi:hypothetical protein